MLGFRSLTSTDGPFCVSINLMFRRLRYLGSRFCTVQAPEESGPDFNEPCRIVMVLEFSPPNLWKLRRGVISDLGYTDSVSP